MLQTLRTNPSNFCENLQVKSPGAHFENDNLTLAQIKKSSGDTGIFTVKALLNILVADLVEFVNVGKSMTPDQIIKTVELIIDEYQYYKPEDFKLCFNRAKKGFYGPLYDRLDGQLILGWLGQYDQERSTEIEQLWQNANTQLKKRESEPVLTTDAADNAKKDAVFASNMAKLKADMDERKRLREKAKTPPPVDYSPVYVKSQIWLAQFDKLHLKKPIGKSTRFIKRYGRVLDINGYLEHKHWQYNEFAIKGRPLYEVKLSN